MRKENELSACVRRSVEDYFSHLDGEPPATVYDMVLRHVERPLLETVLKQARGNQSLAAEYLGINRNTLRKKIRDLGIQ
jgi:Fis family transcriptional regulator